MLSDEFLLIKIREGLMNFVIFLVLKLKIDLLWVISEIFFFFKVVGNKCKVINKVLI